MSCPDNTALLLVGPTAVGKTDLSIGVAQALRGEIVSADSRQIYRHMDIGTAKPSAAHRSSVPHHFIDIVNPDQNYTAGEYGRQGRKVIRSILERGLVPVVVGGSGLYIRALVDGFYDEMIQDLQVRARLKEESKTIGTAGLHERLVKLDPETAARIHPHDVQRIVRALEVHEIAGCPLSAIQERGKQTMAEFDAIFVGLTMSRERLYLRIERRVEEMLRQGLVDEVNRLSSMGYGRHLNAMQTVGYQEIFACLEGEMDLGEAVRLIKQNSRHYAKRQLTWFRKDQRVRWLKLSEDTALEMVIGQVVDLYRNGVSGAAG